MNVKPKCVIVTGRPGSGKTTLARKLGERLWLPVISRDELKEGYVNTYGVSHDQLPPDTNALVSNTFFEIVNHYLAANISIVIEAAFQHPIWEPRMLKLLDLSWPYFIVCTVEAKTAAKRHLQRGLDNSGREFYHGDRRVTIYRNTGTLTPPDNYAAPAFNVPTIQVSTEGDYIPSIEEIVKQLQSEEISTYEQQ